MTASRDRPGSLSKNRGTFVLALLRTPVVRGVSLAALVSTGLAVAPTVSAPDAFGAADQSMTRTGHARPGVDPATSGLYGAGDPTYDGVYRQGLALLALRGAGARPQRRAVRWLLRQQCDDGRWTSYRADVSARCGRGDSNATAMAVMALRAVGRDRAARQGLRWLKQHQLRGGGWEYSRGWGADANSTGLVLQAVLAMGQRPARVTVRGDSGFDFLRRVQLRCGASPADRGALAYQVAVPLQANGFATAQATQALARTALPVRPAKQWVPAGRLDCANGRLERSARTAAASWLAAVLRRHNGTIPNAFGKGPDLGATANAVLSLVAVRTARAQAFGAAAALRRRVRDFVLDGRDVRPAAAALLVLTQLATRADPRDVKGFDLVARIRSSIR